MSRSVRAITAGAITAALSFSTAAGAFAAESSSPQNGPNAASAASAQQPKLAFSQLTSTVTERVHAQYPGASLLEVRAKTPGGGVQSISTWNFVYTAVKDNRQVTVLVDASVGGEVQPFTVVPHPWLGDRVLTMPIGMEPQQADKLLKKAGYTAPYKSVVLRHPLTWPVIENPLFIFNPGADGFVGVDVKTGEVKPLR
ncbi:hypothetical protein [Longimycelium tulufanense]|nr:hypothetical protein [Longimycelium tulufanense]